MKRINPNTNLPFKYKDVRSDGFIFKKYRLTKIKKNGYFEELWISPESWIREIERSNRYRSLSNAKYSLSVPGRAQKLLKHAKERCKGSVFIDQNWIENKLNFGICELTGISFDFAPLGTKLINPYAPSLDRIDNSNRDYSPENTRVVLASVNLALNSFGLETMLPIFKAIIENQYHDHTTELRSGLPTRR
jgi:hypothetical protein